MKVPVTPNVPTAFTRFSMLLRKCRPIVLNIPVALFSSIPLSAQNINGVKRYFAGKTGVAVPFVIVNEPGKNYKMDIAISTHQGLYCTIARFAKEFSLFRSLPAINMS